MVRPLLFLLLMFAGFSGFAQRTYQKEFDAQHRLVSEGWMFNGHKCDYWIFYYPNGQKREAGHYFMDVRVKYWHFYDVNGKKTSEGHYELGARNNWWIFYSSGQTIKVQFENNLREGYCIISRNNNVERVEQYRADVKIKEWTDARAFLLDHPGMNFSAD